jgi:cell division protein FtsI (penicillin-binding protein 3)
VQVETAAASFGQGISVTNLQIAMGVTAIANGGRLLEPALVKRVTDGTGAVLTEASPRVRREAVPAHVARLLAEMLVAVTEGEGTGVEAAIPGFRVAGKTATAQKIDPATGKYTDTHYVASFMGFVPAERPRLAIAVVLDEPMAGTYAGGSVAAPVFRRVGEMALRYLGVTPRGSVPMKLSDVTERAKVGDPADKTYALLGAKGQPDAKTDGPAPSVRAGEARLPDLAGMPAREAIKQLVQLGFSVSMEGSGILARQEPAAGAVVPRGSTVKLVFEPPT